MDLKDLKAVIVTRQGCFKCGEIQWVLNQDKVQHEVVYFHEGGAALLADLDHLPMYLPCTILYKDGKVVQVSDGLSGFLEDWEKYKEENP